MNKIIRPASREEWLECRRLGIGSSEIATIVGFTPLETPYQLWRRKTGQDPAKSEPFAMKAGHYLEDAVAQFWRDEMGCDIIKRSAVDYIMINLEKPFMRVSPDREYWLRDMPRNAQNNGILECKTTQKAIDGDDLPKHWFCQVQYQLGVAELQEGSLAWLCSGREFSYKNLAFVPDFFAWLAAEVERFWVDNIQGGQESEAVSVQDVLLKFDRHTEGKTAEVSDEIFEAYKSLKDIRRELAELGERKAALDDKIKLCFRNAEALS